MSAPISLDIDVTRIVPNKLNCWAFTLPTELGQGDTIDDPHLSDLVLYEDGRPLGPAHADHSRIRLLGRGLYSHWHGDLYFSTSDNSDPRENGRVYRFEATPRPDRKPATVTRQSGAGEEPLFPKLSAMDAALRKIATSADLLHDPAGDAAIERMRLLEAKVEYLLDELYTAKSQLRRLLPGSQLQEELSAYQVSSFNFQWHSLPYHDAFLTNPAWREKAAPDVAARLGVDVSWFKGKKILDCGCGPGRHAWTFSSLGAHVTAFDLADSAVAAAREACADYPGTRVFKHSILAEIPEPNDFDLVWSYGVVHNSGDAYGALKNIARHAKPGGLLYFMVYPEPERTNLTAYRYYHEIYVMRQILKNLSFDAKAEVLKAIQGERWAMSWFDAISSEVNDLYTFEELESIVRGLGFGDVRRTMPQEQSINVVAVRR